MRRSVVLLTSVLVGWGMCCSFVEAQPFTIINAGELELGSNEIVLENTVQKYFGMNVSGSGEGIFRAKIGDQTFSKSQRFALSETRLSSFLLANELARELSAAFRRGVKGTVTIELLDTAGNVNDSIDITFDVVLDRRKCKQFPDKRVKGCRPVDLGSASRGQTRLFLKRFVNSVRGPIVLEP